MPDKGRPLRILLVAAEYFPFAKVGGLADQTTGLARALAARGHDVTVAIPAHRNVPRGRLVWRGRVRMGSSTFTSSAMEQRESGIRVLVFSCGRLFDTDRIYVVDGDEKRFIAFSQSVVAFAAAASPEFDVVHAAEWHTGLIPHAITHLRNTTLAFANTATVFSVYGIYRGRWTREIAALAEPLRFPGSLLLRGITYADAVTTVSNGFLRQMLDGGRKRDKLPATLTRAVDRTHVVLGALDYATFDPAADANLVSTFDTSTLDRRLPNKHALVAECFTDDRPNVPLIGFVGRVQLQKGIELLMRSLPSLIELDSHVIAMGVGLPYLERRLRSSHRRNEAFCYREDASELLARRIYASADILLVPSLIEPFGLTPLIAMRYGAIPVVHRTGGLDETVEEISKDGSSGFGYGFTEPTVDGVVEATRRGFMLLRNKRKLRVQQVRGMNARWSWDRSAGGYERVYLAALSSRNRGIDPLLSQS